VRTRFGRRRPRRRRARRTGASGRYDTTRVEAFSDGVFAVAMTVLVFDLTTPKHRPGHLLEKVLEQWPVYVSFLASFAYVGVLWMNHHATFARIARMDPGLRFLNLLLLLDVVVLPFPTAMMSEALREDNLVDARTAIGIYATGGALMCVSWLLFFHHLTRHRELAEPQVHERFFHGERTRAWVGIALYLLGGSLGLAVLPELALVVFVALPVFYGVTSEGLTEPIPEDEDG
jgi:uncharacterized membrane protein